MSQALGKRRDKCRILYVLNEHGDEYPTAAEVAEEMGFDPRTMGPKLAALTQAGLASAHEQGAAPGPGSDRPPRRYSITQQGLAYMQLWGAS